VVVAGQVVRGVGYAKDGASVKPSLAGYRRSSFLSALHRCSLCMPLFYARSKSNQNVKATRSLVDARLVKGMNVTPDCGGQLF
jgi:hypothetical protein